MVEALVETMDALREALAAAPRHAGLLAAVFPLALLATLNLLALLRVARRLEACRRSVEALSGRMSEIDAARKSKTRKAGVSSASWWTGSRRRAAAASDVPGGTDTRRTT